MTRLEACLFLRMIPGIGNVRAKRLVERCRSAEKVFEKHANQLLDIEGIGTTHTQALKTWKQFQPLVDDAVAFIEKHHIQSFFLGDSAYPKPLSFCPDAPLVLFYKGKIDFGSRRIISIVGTRQNTAYGADFCEYFIKALQPLNPVIVSGFAYGIDITAHRTAIKYGLDTIGCLAHGLDKIYPPAHMQYVAAIEQQGGFITDFMHTEPFERNNFPRRNRIIAGLSHATVVVETANKGGSMNTADLAHQYGREVFAVPGRITDLKSKGCHRLIVQNKAQLLCHPEDFIASMGWHASFESNPIQKQLFVSLTEEEEKVLGLLKDGEKESLDVLALKGQFSVSQTATLLMQLEMKSCVRPLPGKYFERI